MVAKEEVVWRARGVRLSAARVPVGMENQGPRTLLAGSGLGVGGDSLPAPSPRARRPSPPAAA